METQATSCQIIENGKQSHQITDKLTTEEIILAYTNFSKGMVANWREHDFSYDLLLKNQPITDWFFAQMAGEL